MSRRPLPTAQEAIEILSRRRTRPPHRPPPVAGRALHGLVKALDEKYGQGPGLLHARWREIVGEQLARRTEPVKLIKARGSATGGVLELKVDGPAATLVQHQAGEILARLDLLLGKGAVTKLRIVQGVVKPREAVAQPKRRRPPLDAAAEAGLERSLEGRPDDPLRRALLRLGREVLRGGPR